MEKFVIDREVGRGGMGIVYRARDVRDERIVALKVIRTVASTGSAARFRREIALAARLAHSNILSPIDSGETDGRLWYTMPLIDGESLRARLQRSPIDRAESVSLLIQIASALEHAHAEGIVHRDLKPDNVLLSSGRPIIVDFGVAKAILAAEGADDAEHSTATGVALGTPSYMLSPEDQEFLIRDHPKAFKPSPGAWGRSGATSVLLRLAPRRAVTIALEAAWARRAPKKLRDAGSNRRD